MTWINGVSNPCDSSSFCEYNIDVIVTGVLIILILYQLYIHFTIAINIFRPHQM